MDAADLRQKKRRRCFQRVMSGLTRGGKLRFLTLTSSPDAPVDIEKSWRALYMRMKRRGLIQGYVKVPELTKEGRKHLHVLFRGSFIPQATLSLWWSQIHNSKIVDIRLVKVSRQHTRVAGYMAKYMSKETAGHYSWSWGWVWKGFCLDWQIYKRFWWAHIHREGETTFRNLLAGWNSWLKGYWHPKREEMLAFLAEPGIYAPGTAELVHATMRSWLHYTASFSVVVQSCSNAVTESLRPRQAAFSLVEVTG